MHLNTFSFPSSCLWSIVNEQSVEGQWVWQNVVADIVAADRQRSQRQRVSIGSLCLASGELDRLEMRVHENIHSCHCALDHGAVLELNHHAFIREFHEESWRGHKGRAQVEVFNLYFNGSSRSFFTDSTSSCCNVMEKKTTCEIKINPIVSYYCVVTNTHWIIIHSSIFY